MRLLFLIRDLSVGGAQRQLLALANELQRRGHDIQIATFYPLTSILTQADPATNVRVTSLEKRGPTDILHFASRLLRLVRSYRPQILHAYMGGANVATLIVKAVFPSIRIVWGVRSSIVKVAFPSLRIVTDVQSSESQAERYPLRARLTICLEQTLARFADLTITNSSAARRALAVSGRSTSKIKVVSNGIDTHKFRPDPAGGKARRLEWGIPEDALLVGNVGRLDPRKGHLIFVEAAKLIKSQMDTRAQKVMFVCVGTGNPEYEALLRTRSKKLGLEQVVIWAGERHDIVTVYSSLDVMCLSSFVEGFPNVAAEAMSCGIPTVATTAGDTSGILGSAGFLVPPQDPPELARRTVEFLSLPLDERKKRGATCRARIESNFSIFDLGRQTERALEGILK